MSDGMSHGYRAQCEAEERALRRFDHLSDGELRARNRIACQRAETLRAVIRLLNDVLRRAERDADDLVTVALSRRDVR